MSIFWDFSNYDKIELLPCPIITTGTQDMGNGVYKLAAGTPLKKSTQAVSNDGNADCVVAEDYFFIATKADQSKLVPVITKGYVDQIRAEAAWGGEYAKSAVSALAEAGIILVDGALEAGGSGLPEVSATDNGDVLTVVEGAWAAAAPSGGGGVLVVNASDGITLDKTWQEIHDADFAYITSLEGFEYIFNIVYDPQMGYAIATFKPAQDIDSGKFVISVRAYVAATADGYPVKIHM